MAFKLGTQEVLGKPIARKVMLPVCNEAGTPVNHQITLLYNRMTVEEIGAAYAALAEDARMLEALTGPELTAAVLDMHATHVLRLASGWREVQAEDGAEAAFTFDNVRALLNSVPKAYDRITEEFQKANRGGAALGN
ncbi:protein of unknown function [Methylococcus capsulatus]|jgi:hypothetical protein|uniref:Tail assembly chaperone n=1 Tax=Methylococcus capsulatus TaxID=414 RepID=A0AA35V1P7_METCP|nr:phage tail assembly chaperone [Methylococcus capsulatus]CAI8742672.1 protein of unknown function [Methylococcus capsulatus]